MSEIEKKLINIIKHCDDSVDTKEINNNKFNTVVLYDEAASSNIDFSNCILASE